MGFDVSQLRSLSVDLKAASEQVTAKAEMAIRKTALDIEADAKVAAPVDTGNLRASISTTFDTPLSAEIGPTASYGVYQEYGTSRMRPQPFMGPAFDRRAPGLAAALEQIAGRIL